MIDYEIINDIYLKIKEKISEDFLFLSSNKYTIIESIKKSSISFFKNFNIYIKAIIIYIVVSIEDNNKYITKIREQNEIISFENIKSYYDINKQD